jgi:hypothetical protein
MDFRKGLEFRWSSYALVFGVCIDVAGPALLAHENLGVQKDLGDQD